MDPQILASINESLDLTRRLAKLLEQDKNEISDCISGEVVIKYTQGTESALELIKKIQAELLSLQGM